MRSLVLLRARACRAGQTPKPIFLWSRHSVVNRSLNDINFTFTHGTTSKQSTTHNDRVKLFHSPPATRLLIKGKRSSSVPQTLADAPPGRFVPSEYQNATPTPPGVFFSYPSQPSDHTVAL